MELNEYQIAAQETALYKEKVIYPVLGLVDECSELMEKIENKDTDYAIALEIGDQFWYLAALTHDLDLPLHIINNPSITLSYVSYNPLLSLGKICGRAKKWLRDFEGQKLPDDYKKVMILEMQKLFKFLSIIAEKHNYKMESILKMNIEKLLSRKERGVIKGDGDYR